MFDKFGIIDLCAAWIAIGACLVYIGLLCWNGYDDYRNSLKKHRSRNETATPEVRQVLQPRGISFSACTPDRPPLSKAAFLFLKDRYSKAPPPS